MQGEQVLKIDEKTESHQLVLAKQGSMTPAEYDETIADLVNYLVFMAEPFKERDKNLGLLVLAFLGLLFVLTYYLKKEFWKDIH